MRCLRDARALTLLLLALTLGVLAAPHTARAAPDPGTGTTCFPGTIRTTFGYTTNRNCSAEVPTADGGVSVTFHAYVAAPSVAPVRTMHLTGFRQPGIQTTT